jgi:hypothetical protein
MHNQEVKSNPQQIGNSRSDLQDHQIEIDQLRNLNIELAKRSQQGSTHHKTDSQALEMIT